MKWNEIRLRIERHGTEYIDHETKRELNKMHSQLRKRRQMYDRANIKEHNRWNYESRVTEQNTSANIHSTMKQNKKN